MQPWEILWKERVVDGFSVSLSVTKDGEGEKPSKKRLSALLHNAPNFGLSSQLEPVGNK